MRIVCVVYRIAFVRLALAFLAIQVALILLRLADAAGVRAVIVAVEVHHAIQAGEGGASTLVAMAVEPFLGQNVAAGLPGQHINKRSSVAQKFQESIPRKKKRP